MVRDSNGLATMKRQMRMVSSKRFIEGSSNRGRSKGDSAGRHGTQGGFDVSGNKLLLTSKEDDSVDVLEEW